MKINQTDLITVPLSRKHRRQFIGGSDARIITSLDVPAHSGQVLAS
jgi:hypothetical protein